MIELSRRTLSKNKNFEIVESKTRLGKTFFVYKYDETGRLAGTEAFSSYLEAWYFFKELAA